MFLSIVVPTYNRANLIESTLETIKNQDCQDFEVIIVDDGSTDNTENVVQRFLSQQFKYVKIANSERGAARNRGAELAKGQYVNWFDSDDEMLPNHVSTLKELAAQNNSPEVITVLLNIKNQDQSIQIVKHKYSVCQKKRKHFLIEGNFLACNAVCIRKDIALDNPFVEDRNLSASEDYELWLRLLAKYRFVQSNRVTSYLIQHDQRSVNTMVDASKLENRFTTFIQAIKENHQLKTYLGEKDFNYLIMRNYLLLALELAYCGHKKKAIEYLKIRFSYNYSAVFKLWFWLTVKHLVIQKSKS